MRAYSESAERALRNMVERKQRYRVQSLQQWDRDFFALLPSAEHPDYIKPRVEDLRIDRAVEKSSQGKKLSRTTRYRQRDRRIYSIREDFPSRHFTILHGRYSEDITETWRGIVKARKTLKNMTEAGPRILGEEASLETPFTEDELIRFFGAKKMPDRFYNGVNRFLLLVDSADPGNCPGCGRFKKKTTNGFFICKDLRFRRGRWEHK
ncbi:MAG: hypothetical protein ACQEXN_10270 [Actinomycetota bacterium]